MFAISSDYEPALYKPFLECFPNADHLLCTIHTEADVKNACKDLDLQGESENFIRNIFGVRDGDAKTDAEFDTMYNSLKAKWLNG